MITFDYTGQYTCECGKEFKKSQSFNAHKSNCRIHLGEQRWLELEKIRKSRSSRAVQSLKNKYIEQKRSNRLEYLLSPKYCLKCGSQLSFEKRDRRYCSNSCANSHTITLDIRQKISNTIKQRNGHSSVDLSSREKLKVKPLKEYVCLFCNQIILSRRSRKFCSSECCKNYHDKQKRIKSTTLKTVKQRKSKAIKLVKVKLKRNLTCFEAGIMSKSYGGRRPGSGRGICGWYKGFWCDSQWELAFIVYCLDNNISIKRNQTGYKYLFEGKEHKYFPDFIINNELYEIKGYFKAVDYVKHAAVKNLGLILHVLTFKDLIKVFNYIKEVYKLNKDEVYKLYDNYMESYEGI